MLNIVKKFTVCWVLLAAVAFTTAADDYSKAELVTETYAVKYGDTLWDIAGVYKAKNTYGKREIREFKEGIIQLNINEYPQIRYGYIYPGNELKINYWVKKED